MLPVLIFKGRYKWPFRCCIDVNFYKLSFINCLCFDQSSLVLIKTFFRNLKFPNSKLL